MCAAMALACVSAVHAQSGNPSSATNPYFGSVTLHPATDEVLQLSLDDAVRRGLDNNLGLREAEAGEKQVLGQKNQALQEFLPTITVSGGTGVFQHNLAALGFNAGVIDSFKSVFPGGTIPAGLTTITRDDLTQGQVGYSQTLFSGPVIAGWRAAKWCNRWRRRTCMRLPQRAKSIRPRRCRTPIKFCLIRRTLRISRERWPTWMNCGRGYSCRRRSRR